MAAQPASVSVRYERATDVHGALVDLSPTAELAIMARAVGRSTAEQVAAHAACPVIIAGAPDGRRGPIVLALDARAGATAATAFAFAEADLRGVELHAVYVSPEQPEAAFTTVDPFAYEADAADAESDRLLAEALAGWCRRYPDVVVRRRARHEPNIAAAMAREAGRAGLLVVGARDHPRLSARLLGSATTEIMRYATGPVAVVPSVNGSDPKGTP
jgi:nucleotide-binding universal stress UspA family protein